MRKFKFLWIGIFLFFIFIIVIKSHNYDKESFSNNSNISGIILSINDNSITILDNDNLIYNINLVDNNFKVGDYLFIEYTGNINYYDKNQGIEVINYDKIDMETNNNGIPVMWEDNGIFNDYYVMAFNSLKNLSLEEKIGQLLLVRYPDNNVLDVIDKYNPGGFLFFAKDFALKSKTEVISMINILQESSNIPLLTAVDEEGGSVVRVSCNPKLASSSFKSPRELYLDGGFEKIREDTIIKSNFLMSLGLNLNLAPVVDISTNSSDYIYSRSLGEDAYKTSIYSKIVIESSKNTGVSYTLKHFPGYGNNVDTHLGIAIDNRSFDDILSNDIVPFQSGISAGAEAVLVSHNIVTNIDEEYPASLSSSIHNLLRYNLKFTGIIITDDIAMNALNSIDDIAVKAIMAGNDLIITTNFQESFNQIKNAVDNNIIDEFVIDQHVFRILAWKYYKKILVNIN